MWAQDLGVEIDKATGMGIWGCATNISELKVLDCLQISFQLLQKWT